LFVHAYDNKELTWFAPERSCNGDGHFRSYQGGDSIILGIFNNGNKNIHGAWCDSPNSKTSKYRFICESLI